MHSHEDRLWRTPILDRSWGWGNHWLAMKAISNPGLGSGTIRFFGFAYFGA